MRIKNRYKRMLNVCDEAECIERAAIQWVLHGPKEDILIELCKKHWDQFNREEDMDGKIQVTL